MAAETIIYYGEGRRELLNDFYKNNIFGLSPAIGNKDQAFFIASWGIGAPESYKKRDNSGWIRSDYIKFAEEKAIMSAPLLSTAVTDDDIGDFAEYGVYKDYFEKCVEKGFQVIEEKVKEAGWDNNLLERRVLSELDLLYTNYIENDI